MLLPSSTSLLTWAALASTGLANINFTWVQPHCTEGLSYTGCLKGQECHNTDCVPIFEPLPEMEHGNSPEKRQTAPRADGRCGTAFGGATCDPNGAYGGCCSQYGWCGNSAVHCLASNGCQSGCTNGATTLSSAVTQPTGTGKVTTDGTCGTQNGGTICGNWPQGGCCSPYGWCGNSPAHCGTGCQSGCSAAQSSSSSPPQPSASGKVTTDGTCGTQNGGTICGNWPLGGCCSEYGWCGNSPAHCGTGCQSGCNSASSSSATSSSTSSSASASSTAKVTTDGSCGANYGGTVCGNWPQGSCCSMYGFCGSTTTHCGDGCQSGPCLNGAVTPAPGPKDAPMNANPGNFQVVGQSGVPAMHAGLLPNGRVVMLDKVENYTQLKLPNGQYAYSSEYNPQDNTVVPLAYKTNSFCAGGIFSADGDFLSLGGNAPLDFIDPTVGDGFTAIRHLKRSATDASLNGQDWIEPGNKLASARWYPSAQIMPDSTIFVAAGSLNGLDPSVKANNNPTYEVLNAQGVSSGQNVPMDLLVNNQPYYMYPFIHLLPTGDLYVFVAKSSQIFNVASNTVKQTFPELPGDYRTYPNTGGSVMLPLSSANNWNPEVVVCGGGPYQDITAPTDASCGRISPLGANPQWELDAMPEGRCMVEGVLLPDGTVLFLNGANQGGQGFDEATKPTLETLIYDPAKPLGQRFTKGASSAIPRLYHSVALLLLDGTVLVTGSNPVEQPMLQPTAAHPYVTEFRVEIYTPPYLASGKPRPTDVVMSTTNLVAGNGNFNINFNAPAGAKDVKVVLYYGGFVTHSVHMGHRMVYLDNTGFNGAATAQSITVNMPKDKNIAPPGPYVVYVVVDGVPAIGQFVMVK